MPKLPSSQSQGPKATTLHFSPAILASPPLPERAPALFAFMKKREALRCAKATGASWPWSDDEILNEYKFTNVKREHDRTTAWMREHFTRHAASSSAGVTVFNCALFRIFGTTHLASRAGWTFSDYDARAVERAAQECRREHGHAFTSAYCLVAHNSEIASEESAQRAYERVCRKSLQAVWDKREKFDQACATGSWRTLIEMLRQTPGFGGSGFMAKEVALDVMQTPHLRRCVDRNDWCPVGPGARRGLNRLHGRPTQQAVAVGGASEARFLREMLALFRALLEAEPEWCRALDIELHDVQFQLCEFDKYERIRTREGGKKTKYLQPPAPPAAGAPSAAAPPASSSSSSSSAAAAAPPMPAPPAAAPAPPPAAPAPAGAPSAQDLTRHAEVAAPSDAPVHGSAPSAVEAGAKAEAGSAAMSLPSSAARQEALVAKVKRLVGRASDGEVVVALAACDDNIVRAAEFVKTERKRAAA